jgi:antitoxin component YwqK of YwqJK toxin-antitoxin module
MIKQTQLLSLLFTILFTSLLSVSYAQEVDTIEIEGEQYFVYPFKVKVKSHSQYSLALKKSTLKGHLSYKKYKELALEGLGEEMTKKEFKDLKKQIRKFRSRYRGERRSEEEGKHLSRRKFVKAVRENPYPLLQQRYRENTDITPMLDPIPDGKYVQLYEEFCFINEKGDCEGIGNRVAGYFTMKNNTLDGEAMWVDLKGDTLKHGMFVNGIKQGEWKFERRSLDYGISEEQADLYIERGFPDIDTLTEYITYDKGAKTGRYRRFQNSEYPIEEGAYDNGQQSGTWVTRDIITKGYGRNEKRFRNNELVTMRMSFESNDTLVAHPRWIRKDFVGIYGADREQFNFYPKYSRPDLPRQMYEIAYEEEEILELEEELQGAPYDLDHYEEDYYDDLSFEDEYYGNEFGYSDYEARKYDKNSKKYINRGVLLDSIGARPKYSGTYEVTYKIGQRAFKYEFENGNLVAEDTIFWDNGTAHDVITEVPDSNQYLRSIYDYDGKLYLELAYDSLGDFIRIERNHEEEEVFVVDGYEVTGGEIGSFYFYNIYDTLDNEAMVDSTLLFQSWFVDDSTKMYRSMYYPDDKRFTSQAHSVMGSVMMKKEKSFSDDFESWTGKEYMWVGNIEMETTSSGSLHEYYEPDSIPIRHIRSDERFRVASEYILSKNGQPYTGPVELKFGEKKLKISKDDLTISLPETQYTEDKLEKDLERYRKTGKTKYPIIMNLIDPTETGESIGNYVYYNFFRDPLGDFFNTNRGDYYYDDYYDDYDESRTKDKDADAVMTNIEGFMVDGKPNGLWISLDQFGEKMTEVNFTDGEANGEVITYRYAFPKEENEYDWMDYDYENPLRDSFPAKRVHYVSNVSNYLNGKMHGEEVSYSWYGDVTRRANYEDGFLEGKSIERNKLATTEATYRYGEPDGYVRTYLTHRPGDSILLYNLNFQDGVLQGESKAFHTNGKLAKRGFFLDGRPIEDYEAYDSLGFKYHYVKFQYSFPIEEKIWEENELSVRYLFDWQDSIYFEPSDITTSQSLEKIISNLGLGGGYFERPYFGRKSLVDKSGIPYHMTKYYPNDTISRDGDLDDGRKVGCWKYYSYNGELLYEVQYQDSIIEINDSIKFKSKGVLTDFDVDGNPLYEAYVIEMSSKYDCAHTDHYEIRQLYTKWESNDSLGRMDGYVQNFYDNGTLQSEGNMKNGLPDGVWKYYDPYGKLNQYGVYVLGKRDARWLSGDLSKTKYLGDICLNPNLPDLEKEIKYRENLLDIKITNYRLGRAINSQYYDINMNAFMDAEEEEAEDLEESMEE